MDHPLRVGLANELHARPFLRIGGAVSLTHFAIYSEGDAFDHEALLRFLCTLTGLEQPDDDPAHWSARWDPENELKWERHTEFSSFTFVERRHDADYFSDLATRRIPPGWFRALEGKRLVAVRIELVPAKDAAIALADASRWFDTSALVGGSVLGGGAQVYCDWKIARDGFLRFMVVDNGLREVQAGRLLQRLYEIETYRMMALLAWPVARALGKELEKLQTSLAPLMHRMDVSQGHLDDANLLVQLTHIAVRVEALATAARRFSASTAYDKLVTDRIDELNEQRIEGMPTIAEFMQRRFRPTIDTCKAVWSHHEQFAARVARAVDLLRTRVNLAQEEDTTRLLEGMNQTARSQLRLQHAVEGLSVAAISYYVLSLSSHAFRALHAAHFEFDPEIVQGMLILPVILLVVIIMRRITRTGKAAALVAPQALAHENAERGADARVVLRP